MPPLSDANVRIRDAPLSPVRLELQNESWAQPSNADIEDATTTPSQQDNYISASTTPPALVPARAPNSADDRSTGIDGTSSASAVSAIDFDRTGPLDLHLTTAKAPESSPLDTQAEVSRDTPGRHNDGQDGRSSDDADSTLQQPASAQLSAATSASSVSAANDSSECPTGGESPVSSILGECRPQKPSTPQLQCFHTPEDESKRVSSVPSDGARSASNSDLLEGAGRVRHHLAPNAGHLSRTSLSRPQSSYSNHSEYGLRSRSPSLMPGGAQMRTPSIPSRNSPDVRISTYAELLHVPYPQQAPAPLSLDNSNLRNAVGNNASLLSTQKTLEMYRQNVKKTTDPSIQYSFAVFLISTAQEQGLDLSDPKSRKCAPQPVRDLESPIVEGSVSPPYELVREARQILQRLASSGYPFAQYYLADGFASGLFNKGKEDYGSAFPLFALAAKHGHAESAYRTALCYEFGWGCRKDPVKAVQYLRTAASKRHPGAMTRLGKACLSGDLGEKRYREGIKWMKLATEAADAQYNSAPYQLGCLYETGYGDDVFRDASYAAELFTQAAELGHPEANFRMGDAYEHGRLDCPRDPALSVHFYTGAAERGHAGAMMGLCAWYMVGAPPILDKDEEEAYEWARRSAESGTLSRETVGLCFVRPPLHLSTCFLSLPLFFLFSFIFFSIFCGGEGNVCETMEEGDKEGKRKRSGLVTMAELW